MACDSTPGMQIDAIAHRDCISDDLSDTAADSEMRENDVFEDAFRFHGDEAHWR